MSVQNRAPAPTFLLASVLAIVLTLLTGSLVPYAANAQTVRDHRTPPIVRDHRARLCRVAFDAMPNFNGNPLTIATCHLAENNTQTVGSFCSCSVLVEGHFIIVGGSIVLASNG